MCVSIIQRALMCGQIFSVFGEHINADGSVEMTGESLFHAFILSQAKILCPCQLGHS